MQTTISWNLSALKPLCPPQKSVILADAHIFSTHGAFLQSFLGCELLPVPPQKTREAKQALEDTLLKRQFGKDSLFIALGGGTTTDLVGFLASTYMRGVRLIFVPTTLLAMVDAAIGGKTAVDTPFGKNLIGTFYLPEAIFIHTPFLQTLPDLEKQNGRSEILKYGLIAHPILWHQWDGPLEFLIEQSIETKLKIVREDLREERGLRHILNFGHTVGHALELLSQFQMPHGKAVALGCMAESMLSHLFGLLSATDLQQILQLYRKLGYTFEPFDPKALLNAMTFDKKTRDGQPRFALIDRIGHAAPFEGNYCTSVPLPTLQTMIDWMNHG